MLLKALCIAIVGYTYYCILTPPKPGGEVSKTDDKFAKDSSFVYIHYLYATTIGPPSTIILTGLYLFLMWQGKIPSDIKLWQAVAVAIHLFVCHLRMEAYRELGRMFTVSLPVCT
jgi:hypothetical protein